MPEKKPTTRKKTTTSSKATTSKAKAASTKAKKAPVKKAAAPKTAKAAPKKTVKKSSVTKSAAPTKLNMSLNTTGTALTFGEPEFRFLKWDQWQDLFSRAVSSWQHIVASYVLILVVSGLLYIVTFVLFGALFLSSVGGMDGLENMMANLMVGTMPDLGVLWMSSGIFLAWLTVLVFLACMVRVAFLVVIRDYFQGVPVAAIREALFQEGLQRALSYAWLGCLVFFYLTWPIALFLVIIMALQIFSVATGDAGGALSSPLSGAASGFVIFGLFLYLIYAGIRMIFAMPYFVHSKNGGTQAFKETLALTSKGWWYNASMWLLFILLLYAVNIIIELVAAADPIILFADEPTATEAALGMAGETFGLVDLLAFFLSVFIFGPITAAFQYLLMLKSAENRGVKL